MKELGKICFPLGKTKHILNTLGKNFEHIMNYVHTAEFLALRKSLNIYINYLMFYPSRKHVK